MVLAPTYHLLLFHTTPKRPTPSILKLRIEKSRNENALPSTSLMVFYNLKQLIATKRKASGAQTHNYSHSHPRKKYRYILPYRSRLSAQDMYQPHLALNGRQQGLSFFPIYRKTVSRVTNTYHRRATTAFCTVL